MSGKWMRHCIHRSLKGRYRTSWQPLPGMPGWVNSCSFHLHLIYGRTGSPFRLARLGPLQGPLLYVWNLVGRNQRDTYIETHPASQLRRLSESGRQSTRKEIVRKLSRVSFFGVLTFHVERGGGGERERERESEYLFISVTVERFIM